MENVKPWYLSKTIWGVIIAAAGLISKSFFSFYIPDVSSNIVEIIGLVLALIGRVKAENFIA
jgi:hypothetical protein